MVLTVQNLPLAQGLQQLLNQAAANATSKSGPLISEALRWTTSNHWSSRFTKAWHSDNKIHIGQNSNTSTSASGSIDIDCPGVSRAYHDITIVPRNAKFLTIPIHGAAIGKRASDFTGIFRPRGKNVLAVNKNGHLVFLFALAKKAFQKQDTTIMPTDKDFANNICARYMRLYEEELDKIL